MIFNIIDIKRKALLLCTAGVTVNRLIRGLNINQNNKQNAIELAKRFNFNTNPKIMLRTPRAISHPYEILSNPFS